MSSPGTKHAKRRSAAERREEIVAVALEHFAEGGLHGTSTEAIARQAGVSQPYLFRLFGTKKELFLAAAEAMTARVRGAFEQAVDGVDPDERVSAMGSAYLELLQDRTILRMQLQTHAAAAADSEIGERARRDYESVMETAGRLGQLEGPALIRFMSTGMFLNVLAALDFEGIEDKAGFTARWCDPEELM